MEYTENLFVLTEEQRLALEDAANESVSTIYLPKQFHDDYFKVLFYARDLFHYIGDYTNFFNCCRKIEKHQSGFDISKYDYDRFNRFSFVQVKSIIKKIRRGEEFKQQLNWYRRLF